MLHNKLRSWTCLALPTLIYTYGFALLNKDIERIFFTSMRLIVSLHVPSVDSLAPVSVVETLIEESIRERITSKVSSPARSRALITRKRKFFDCTFVLLVSVL